MRCLKSFCLVALFLIVIHLPGLAAEKTIYVVGGFNNWDISHPVSMTAIDGLYEIQIDFSLNDEFKISTVNPQGSWDSFDTGTLYTAGSVKINEWTPIEIRKKSPNIKAPQKRELLLKVDLSNMRIMFSTDVKIPEPWSGTLPVMFISTDNDAPVVSKDTYLSATYYLDPMGVEGIEAVGDKENPALLQIKGRGNYTWWGFKKKPYRIKLDKKTALCGMKKSKHFALLAHADDAAAGLKNALGFKASESMDMPWTPSTLPIEVVLNGDYIGLYWLTETIRVDSDRVNVVEQQDLATEDVDGGWLVEIDNYDSDPHVTVKDTRGNPIWFTYKSPEELSNPQEEYLQKAMQSIQDALSTGNEAKASSLVDFRILAKYFIVNQIMEDMESFHGSCYLNRQRGEDDKWKFGPVWDFGNAFSSGRGDNPRFIFDKPEFTQVWIGDFYSMPGFVEIVKEEWRGFLANGPSELDKSIEDRCGEIAVAVKYDARRWPEYDHSDIELQAKNLKKYLSTSLEWIKKQWGSDAGIDNVVIGDYNVSIAGTKIIIKSESRMVIRLATIDGISNLLEINEGINEFTLPQGIYILNGKKIFLHD